jgi:MFS family permease
MLLRILLGAAESVVTPASLAFIKRAFRPEQQGLATGFITAGMIIGPALGSLLGSVLLQQFGWRLLFLFTGLGGCIWLLPWLLIAPNAGAQRVENGSTRGVSRVERSLLPPIPANLIWALTAGSFFYGYYWYFCLSWLPAYLVMRRGLSLMAMGGFTGVPLIAMALVTLLSARIADRMIARGRSAIATRRSFVCLGFTLGSVILVLPAVSSHAAVFATLTASLMGLGVASANFWTLSQTLADSRVVGRVIAYQNMIANFAGILAPMLTGWIVARTRNGFENAILVSGFSLWVAATSFLFLKTKVHSR